MRRRVMLFALVAIYLASTGVGCRLDIFRRGALFRQPTTVVVPQPDPCAPAVVDPCNPGVMVPSSGTPVYPGTTVLPSG